MTSDVWDGDDGARVPLYVLVKGRTSPRNTNLDLATQVIARPVDTTRLERELKDILDCCRNWMSIAEIGAQLKRPLSVTKVLVDVLLERGFLDIGVPAQQQIGDRRLLEKVLVGLQRL
jgi:hypothetical protein